MTEKFKNEDFLQQFFLTKETVMNYFYTSPFFDSSSNNAILKMQNQDLTNLNQMTGKFYELYFVSPDNLLFVILEKYNGPNSNNSEKVVNNSQKVLNAFYILNNEISECPNNHFLFETALINYLQILDKKMNEFVEKKEINYFFSDEEENVETENFIENFLSENNFLFKK